MTTRLTKPVRREVVRATVPYNLIVTLTIEGIELREKSSRTTYLLPYGNAFVRAAALHADAQRRTPRVARASRGLLAVGAR